MIQIQQRTTTKTSRLFHINNVMSHHSSGPYIYIVAGILFLYYRDVALSICNRISLDDIIYIK